MQDLASEFPKFSGVIPPDPHSGWGRLPHAPNTRSGRARRASAPLLGPKPLVPLNFSAVVVPLGSPRVQLAFAAHIQ